METGTLLLRERRKSGVGGVRPRRIEMESRRSRGRGGRRRRRAGVGDKGEGYCSSCTEQMVLGAFSTCKGCRQTNSKAQRRQREEGRESL
jgi:hypothetical protein